MKKIKLTALNQKKLKQKEMSNIRGGDVSCCCACAYANNGGSSTCDNACANVEGGLASPECIQE